MNVQRVKVNIVPGGIIPVTNLSQGDYGRAIMFEVYDGNTPADLSDVQTAFLSGEKPDGKAFTLSGTISSNCVTVTSSYQSTVLSGQIEGKLILIDSDSQLKSALLVWDVEADPSAGSVSSDEDIQDIISAALEIKDEAEQHAAEAGDSALAAAASAASAAESESNAEAWAVGERGGEPVESTDETYHNNSEFYANYAQSIADRLPEGLNPKGTCEFADLPSVADSFAGDMWIISDSFTTTSDFRGGAGTIVGAGAYIYLTDSSKWDIIPNKFVTVGGDTSTNIVTYTSSDNDATTDKTSNGFTSVVTMASGESHSSLFQKISKMFLNIRKLWNTVGTSALASGKTVTGLLGNTDISSVGSTVTGAIKNIDDREIHIFPDNLPNTGTVKLYCYGVSWYVNGYGYAIIPGLVPAFLYDERIRITGMSGTGVYDYYATNSVNGDNGQDNPNNRFPVKMRGIGWFWSSLNTVAPIEVTLAYTFNRNS